MAPRKPIRPGVKTDPKPEQKKRAEKQKSNEPGIWDMIKSFVSDERTRFVAGLMLLLGVLYLIMAFISYFISGAADQSIMELPLSEIKAMRYDTQNWTDRKSVV